MECPSCYFHMGSFIEGAVYLNTVYYCVNPECPECDDYEEQEEAA